MGKKSVTKPAPPRRPSPTPVDAADFPCASRRRPPTLNAVGVYFQDRAPDEP